MIHELQIVDIDRSLQIKKNMGPLFSDIVSRENSCSNTYAKMEKQDTYRAYECKERINIKSVDVLHERSNEVSQITRFPLNIMLPPPSHTIVINNNNVLKNLNHKDHEKNYNYQRKTVRTQSSDNLSYSSNSTHDNNGLISNTSRSGYSHFDNQTVSRKFKQNRPNVFHSNAHQQHGNLNKNRTHPNNTNRQISYSENGPDLMIRRAHGLAERFKSRSSFLKIDPYPPGLPSAGNLWDQLNQAIWDVFCSKAQRETTYDSKINLWKSVFLYFRKCLHSYGLFMVGSTMTGFGLETSDIDICLLTKPYTNDPRVDSLHHLSNLHQFLVESGTTYFAELIFAKVPILKFKDKETGFEVDLNCNNSVGIKNTQLLYCYARLDWRVRPLVVIVKLWAQANNINDARNMTVSSYSWALMVIHYLQCGVAPPVLPCLHRLAPEIFNNHNIHHNMDVQYESNITSKFKSENTKCLGELLIGFLRYYSMFNYSQNAISVRTGCCIPIEECRLVKAPKNDPHQWKCLCIEEPFDYTNTARSVFDMHIFKNIKQVIVCSYKELEKNKVLSSILPVNINQR